MRALLLVSLFVPAVWGQPVSGILFPEGLKTYLALTDAQISTLDKQNVAFDLFSADKQRRVAAVQADLADKLKATPLDAMALGLRYAEIEAIRRDVEDKRTQLRADNAKVLTDSQRVKLKALDDAQRLLGLESEAECQGLIVPPQSSQPPVFVGTGSSGVIGGILTGVPSGIVVSSTLPCVLGTQFPADLTAYLGLTPAQLDSIGQLNADNTRSYTGLQQRLSQLQSEAAGLVGAEVLDPGAIGQAYADIETVSREQREQLAAWRAAVTKVLTPAQAAKVQALVVARGQLSLVNQALCEDLLTPLPAQWFNTATFRNGDFSGLLGAVSRYCAL